MVIYESRAIASYIMNKYCKDEKLNPQVNVVVVVAVVVVVVFY